MAPARIHNSALLGTGISLGILTTTVFAARMYLGVAKQRRFSWEDGWLIAAWAVFVVITVLYLNIGPTIFRLEALAAGEIPLYPEVSDDGLSVQKTFFVTTSGLWICLWLIKASLLSLYKRLVGTVKSYLIAWWIVVGICVVTLAVAITSSMLSCSSMKAWFTANACRTPRDIKAAYISLWYSYAVDVLTDLLGRLAQYLPTLMAMSSHLAVMLLPIQLIRGLQMPTKRKLSIAGLFGLGWICIGVSTLRAAYLGNDSTVGEFKQPSTSWLALWAIVEASIAVIIGCCPGLYREAKIISSKSNNNYYNNRGYNPGGGYRFGSSGQHRSESRVAGGPDIRLESYPRPAAKDRDEGSSQEDLVENLDKNQIRVTRSVHVRETEAGQAI